MDAFIAKITEPEVLGALGIAFFLGFMMRGGGRSPQPTDLSSPGDIQAKLQRVTAQQWAEIDAEIAARRKISAIRILRQYAGLGLKDAKEAVEARQRQRDIVI